MKTGSLIVFDLESCGGDYSDLEKYIEKVQQEEVELENPTRVVLLSSVNVWAGAEYPEADKVDNINNSARKFLDTPRSVKYGGWEFRFC